MLISQCNYFLHQCLWGWECASEPLGELYRNRHALPPKILGQQVWEIKSSLIWCTYLDENHPEYILLLQLIKGLNIVQCLDSKDTKWFSLSLSEINKTKNNKVKGWKQTPESNCSCHSRPHAQTSSGLHMTRNKTSCFLPSRSNHAFGSVGYFPKSEAGTLSHGLRGLRQWCWRDAFPQSLRAGGCSLGLCGTDP